MELNRSAIEATLEAPYGAGDGTAKRATSSRILRMNSEFGSAPLSSAGVGVPPLESSTQDAESGRRPGGPAEGGDADDDDDGQSSQRS